MRPLHVSLSAVIATLVAAAALLMAPSAALASNRTLARIDDAEVAGSLTPDEAALERIHAVFDPVRVDARFLVEGDLPLKSATVLIASVLGDPAVSDATKDALRENLDQSLRGRFELVSPGGIFKLTYELEGGDAVPPDDEDEDGVPDFVEWCADYCDYCWQAEIVELGFMAPDLVEGFYLVGFENMGAYGYCTLYEGTTRIVLNNNFYGFPPNDDPEGDQKGAAKVTTAHEFKHGSQYTNSHWSEGGWVEVDATWMEEVVYPQVNDYFNFVDVPGSPLNNPEQSLDDGGTGGYDDCLWQIFMTETWENQLIVDLWDRRHEHAGERMLDSYDFAVAGYGSSVPEVMAAWTRWNYLTGDRAVPGYGYADAAGLNTAVTWLEVEGLGGQETGFVPHLATRYARHHTLSELPDYPKILFFGDEYTDFRPQVIVKLLDGRLAFDVVEPGASGNGEKTLGYPFSAIEEIGISFPNCDFGGSDRRFSYRMESAPNTGVEEGVDAARLYPASPNPFEGESTIGFALARPRSVDLEIVTAGGRVVRRLAAGDPYEPGEHELVFDGRNDRGDDLPSGVYFAKLSVGGSEEQLVKLTILK